MPNVTKQDLENAMNELRFGLVNLKVDSKQIKEIVGRIEGRLDSFKEDVTKTLKFQAGVEFLNAANASVNNIAGAIYASRRGDQMGVASNSLSAIGTITKGVAAAVLALGPEAFPIALAIFFVGALIDLVGGILAVLPKDEKALVEQIKALLIHERSKELHDQLVVAFNEFEDWEELLGVGTFTAQSWRDLMNQYHLKTGEAVHFCDISAQWLLNAENQDEPASWVDVFEAYAMSMYLRSMIYFKQYASWRDYWEAEMPKADKERQKTLAQIEQEAQTEMRQYFENNVLTTFHTLGWVGRRMAPIWQRGTRDHTWTASVSFMGPGARARTANTKWNDIGVHLFDQFAVLPRNERAEGGEVLWTWKNNTELPYYAVDGNWRTFSGFGNSFDIASMDLAFFGDSEPPTSGESWSGVDVLLALPKGTNQLYLKYFAPEKGLEYDALPKNEKTKLILPSTLGTPLNLGLIGVIRQVRVRVGDTPDASLNPARVRIEAYLLTRKGDQDQVYVVREETSPGAFGPPFTSPVTGIYVNDVAVWAMADTQIWHRAHNAAEADAWTLMENPQSLGAWTYRDLHPGDDGLLIACVLDTFFGYTAENGWQRSEADRGEDGWCGDRLARLPLDAFRMFNATWEDARSWKALAGIANPATSGTHSQAA